MVCSANSEGDLLQPERTAPTNSILAVMPREEFNRIEPGLQRSSFARGEILFEPGEVIKQVYFPATGMVSLVSIMSNGKVNEIGIIGREGMIGLPAILGGRAAHYQAIVQIPGDLYTIDASMIQKEFCHMQSLHDMLLRYSQALLAQVSQTAVANAQCTIDARLAQWLLIVHNSIQSDHLPLTHEFIAEMLGTRRTSVTTAAKSLQQAGIIRYSRGKIVILSRQKLEERACECFFQIQSEFCRLIGDSYSQFCSIS
ncbi:MAG: Crp/Fnr family transcriptional regulator [Leptolyngbyaceae cyanobacterium]